MNDTFLEELIKFAVELNEIYEDIRSTHISNLIHKQDDEILKVLDKANTYSIHTVGSNGSKEIYKENVCNCIQHNIIDPITWDIINFPESSKFKYPKLSVSKYTNLIIKK